MSQNSARLGLGVAVLAAAAGVAFYFASSSDVHSATKNKQPSGAGYAAFPTPGASDHALSWDKPVHPDSEDNLWTYDLFTPVGIRWEPSDNQYVPKDRKPADVVPFGIALVSLKHPHYRYRFLALAESESRKPADSTIVLADEETHVPLRGKIGETVGPAGGKIHIIGYENKLVSGSDGARVRDTVVKVKDLTLNKEFEVRRTPLVFTDKIDAVFAAEDSTAPVWTAHAEGEKYDGNAGSYVIKGIDFETQSVTVAKTWKDDKGKAKSETKDLRPQAPPPPPAPATAASATKPAAPAAPAK